MSLEPTQSAGIEVYRCFAADLEHQQPRRMGPKTIGEHLAVFSMNMPLVIVGRSREVSAPPLAPQ